MQQQTRVCCFSLENISKEMYTSGYCNKWIHKLEVSGFNTDMIAEIEHYGELREGIIYCDPSFSIAGDKTGIVKVAYNYKENFIYISDIDVFSNDSPMLLITKIKEKQDRIHTRIGMDGNYTQEIIWTQLLHSTGIHISRIEYKRYSVDILSKNIKVLVNLGKIKMKKGLLDTESGRILKYQLSTFISKKEGKDDDAEEDRKRNQQAEENKRNAEERIRQIEANKI